MVNSRETLFYESLPVLDSFFNVSDVANYHPLPADWFVGVTDIKNSTNAIENNQYKWVNILGVSPIVGLLNGSNKEKYPYSFGGDGCAICIPPDMVSKVRRVFAASQQIGSTEYGLHLRTALVPVSYIRDHGHDVKVARFRISDSYSQAVFLGGGLNFAEDVLKSESKNKFHISEDENSSHINVDFSGLECRWKEVHPPGKKVISLLIQSKYEIDTAYATYDKVLSKMREIFGFDDQTNPLDVSELNLTLSPFELLGEVRLKSFNKNWFKRSLNFLKVAGETLLGKIFIGLGIKVMGTDWKQYRPDVALNSDYRKFDDMLRLVISGTEEQHRQLREFLDELYENSELAYGMHTADAAIITCMVFAYQQNHIHFVDGSDGGYVQAAKDLKKRLKKMKANPTEQ